MLFKKAFTLLEVVFVIVIIGILSKFGVELLANAYQNFIQTEIVTRQSANSAYAVEMIAKRLQYRVKESVIIRYQADVNNGNWDQFVSLEGKSSDTQEIMEWVGYDVEGFRGFNGTTSLWSGIYDRNATFNDPTEVWSPSTNTTSVNKMIDILSYGDSGIGVAALYFMGDSSDVNGFGWDGNALEMNQTLKPIRADTNTSIFLADPSPTGQDFTITNLLNLDDQSYKLVWSAYAIVYDYDAGELWFYYDYQPWEGQTYLSDGKRALIMDNVSTFKKGQEAHIMRIVVCTKNPKFGEEYSVCKEKTIL